MTATYTHLIPHFTEAQTRQARVIHSLIMQARRKALCLHPLPCPSPRARLQWTAARKADSHLYHARLAPAPDPEYLPEGVRSPRSLILRPAIAVSLCAAQARCEEARPIALAACRLYCLLPSVHSRLTPARGMRYTTTRM